MTKNIDQQLLQNQAAAAFYQEECRQLRVQGLRNIKLLPRLAKSYPDTEELVLEEPSTPNYYKQLKGFGALKKLSLENVAYIYDLSEEFRDLFERVEFPRVPRLRLAHTPMLDRAFAALARLFEAEELELSGVGVVTEDFWLEIGPLLPGLTALSIQEIEMPPEFFSEHLPRMRRLKRLSLSAFCSNSNLLPKLDLSNLTELEELEISKVGLSALPGGFSRLRALKRLNISNVPMTELGDAGSSSKSAPRLFEESAQVLRGLEVLDISGTRLRRLPGNLEAMRLREFRASSTMLASLPKGFLPGELEVLEVPNSSLEELREADFARLTALRRLDVSYTQLKSLPVSAACQKTLRELRLQGISGLRQLPAWVEDCVNLEELDLRQLHLDEFPEKLLLRPMRYDDQDAAEAPHAFRFNDPDSRTNSPRALLSGPLKEERRCRVLIKGIRLRTLDPKLLLTNDQSLLRAYVNAAKRPIRRGNLIFLGDSGAGKRTLMERVTGTSASEWEHCFGMNILEDAFAYENLVRLAGCRPSGSMRVRMMEMSGRSAAQFIHPLFLPNHSLYVILLDGRQKAQVQERAVWWARLVEAYAPNAHIIFAVRQDAASMEGLNIPLLRREVWMDREPEAVYLTGEEPPEEGDLCRKIVDGLQSLMLAELCLPEPWVRLLSHFEQLLETRMMLPQSLFGQLMERYIRPDGEGGNEGRLREYLLAFEGETAGRMAHVSVQDAENMFFHTDWLGEGLYRLMDYVRSHGGEVRSPQAFWETLVDSAQRSYSLAHARLLLDFCVRQRFCYQKENTYVFPGFTSELEHEDQCQRLTQVIQTDERARHFIVHCPVLSQLMLAQLITGIIDDKRIADVYSGQAGLLYIASSAGALLLLGRTGTSVDLHVHFSSEVKKGNLFTPSVQLVLKNAVFDTLRQVLAPLPDHLRRQYRISIERSVGNLADLRSARLAEIPLEELAGYAAAGRSTYFCGTLNQSFWINHFGYLPPLMYNQ